MTGLISIEFVMHGAGPRTFFRMEGVRVLWEGLSFYYGPVLAMLMSQTGIPYHNIYTKQTNRKLMAHPKSDLLY